jgi:hypothetical protein
MELPPSAPMLSSSLVTVSLFAIACDIFRSEVESGVSRSESDCMALAGEFFVDELLVDDESTGAA